MFMLWLYHYITGYVKFKCTGVFFERFLNLCAQNNITIWDSYQQNNILYGYMQVKHYKGIKKIAKKAKVRLRVLEKHGFVFITHRYRRRIGLPVGFAIFFAIIFFLSSIIWNVNVVGNNKIETDIILKELKKVGVFEGQFSTAIDSEGARQKLLIGNPGLSWAAININGTFATVDVRETKLAEKEKGDGLPCNIVASNTGIIVSIMAYEGVPAIKIGEAVAKGDLIVSGTIELKNGVTIFKRAIAKVMAQTEHKLEVFVPFTQSEVIQSTESINHSVLTLFCFDLPLFLGSFDKPCYKQKEVWQPSINGVRLPVKLTTVKFYEKQENTYKISEQQAKDIAIKQMEKQKSSVLKDTVKQESQGKFSVEKNGIRYTKKYLCIENIAKQENILFN